MHDLKIACDGASKNHHILSKLLQNYEIIIETKTQKYGSEILIKKYWAETISQFKTTLQIVAGTTVEQPATIKKILLTHQGLNHRIKSSAAIFLQNCGLRRMVSLLGAICFIIRHGRDGVYLPLYRLFLSSIIFGQPSEIAQVNTDSDKLMDNLIHTRKLWLDSFNKYLTYWRFVTG